MLHSSECRPDGETGRRTGLKIPGPERGVTVRFRLRAPAAHSSTSASPAQLALPSYPRHTAAHVAPALVLPLFLFFRTMQPAVRSDLAAPGYGAVRSYHCPDIAFPLDFSRRTGPGKLGIRQAGSAP